MLETNRNSPNQWLQVHMQEESLLSRPVRVTMFLLYFTSLYTHLDAAVEYSPHDIVQTLNQIDNRLQNISNHVHDIDQRTEGMDQRIGGMDQRMATMNTRITAITDTLKSGFAHTANLRILGRNTRLQAPNVLAPLQKTVRHNSTTSLYY
jgi:septal ring factor EnvC (AmiA/AmiB activator)